MKLDLIDGLSPNPPQQHGLLAGEEVLVAAQLAEKRLREAIDAFPEGIVFLDNEGRYILWNRRYAEIYARSADLLQPGARIADTLRIGVARGDYPEAYGREEEWLAERLEQLAAPSSRYEQRLANGRNIMIEDRRTHDGGTIGLRVDITELRQKQEAFRLLFERNPVALLVLNPETGRLRSANEAAGALFGANPDRLEGMEARALFSESDWAEAAAMLKSDYSDGKRSWNMRRIDGTVVETMISTRQSQLEGYPATIISIFDVTERRRIERRMEHMARHDGLTGLANRMHCRENLGEVLSLTGCREDIAVLIVDLDNFKLVNEAYGHDCADTLLAGAARRLRQFIPADAFLARIGADEFAIILRRASPQEAEKLALALIALLAEPFVLDAAKVHVGATVGFACAPRDSRDADTLLRYAALALYGAKASKRGTCLGFHPGMDAAAQERSALENDFRHAVLTGALEVHYQPMIDLQSGETRGYEALLRWCHPERGVVSPETFVPIAEETGLIEQIGRLVLETACREAANWPDHITLSVNVSPLQFRSGNLLGTVIHALSASGLAPERLELEVTEAVLMEKGPRSAAVMRNLRSFGIGIALDDFGTGYSSLGYLLNYPFTKIKIDKSFILNLEHEPSSRAVIRAIIGLGRSLGLIVTAEGVEHEFVRDYLRDEGCAQAQGFLFGPAEPAPLLPRLMRKV